MTIWRLKTQECLIHNAYYTDWNQSLQVLLEIIKFDIDVSFIKTLSLVELNVFY